MCLLLFGRVYVCQFVCISPLPMNISKKRFSFWFFEKNSLRAASLEKHLRHGYFCILPRLPLLNFFEVCRPHLWMKNIICNKDSRPRDKKIILRELLNLLPHYQFDFKSDFNRYHRSGLQFCQSGMAEPRISLQSSKLTLN